MNNMRQKLAGIQRRRMVYALVVSVALAVLIIGGWHLLQPNPSPPSGTPTVNTNPGTQEKAPTISLLEPKGGETLSGVVKISWSASDPDGDALKTMIQYTTDLEPYCPTCPPQRWHTISTLRENDSTFDWDTMKYPNGVRYQIRLIVSDGTNTHEAVSGPFSIVN